MAFYQKLKGFCLFSRMIKKIENKNVRLRKYNYTFCKQISYQLESFNGLISTFIQEDHGDLSLSRMSSANKKPITGKNQEVIAILRRNSVETYQKQIFFTEKESNQLHFNPTSIV